VICRGEKVVIPLLDDHFEAATFPAAPARVPAYSTLRPKMSVSALGCSILSISASEALLAGARGFGR